MHRPRSNAIAGPSDSRYVSPLELNLRTELAKPFTMDSSLSTFVEQVHRDSRIMSGAGATEPGKSLADEIYSLYSGTSEGRTGMTDFEGNKNFILKLWSEVRGHSVLAKAVLQYKKVALKTLFDHLDGGGKAAQDYFRDFIYFTIAPGSPQIRVYANTTPAHATSVVKFIKDHMAADPQHGIQSFKVVGPAAMQGRTDTVVVYSTSKEKADALANALAKQTQWFNSQVPAMTTQVAPGVGVATGAEPTPQATGMGKKPPGYPESAQSFGTIRCELIAAAVLNYNANKRVVGEGADVLKKFVATAFRGYGLDPARPGD